MPKLRLKVTHTHGGVAYPPGHVIDVDDHNARWLIDQKIGERAIGTPGTSGTPGTPAISDVLPVPEAPAARTPRTHPVAPTPKE